MKQDYKAPVYTIGIVSKMLKVCPATLRIWEKKGLVKPSRIGKNRFYSQFDLERMEYVKKLLQKKHINIEGVKSILATTRCWMIKKCSSRQRTSCPVYKQHRNP